MEYVVGETLAARLAKGPLPVWLAKHYFVQNWTEELKRLVPVN